MQSTPKIRAAHANDADSLKNCMRSAYAAYQDRMGGERLPPMDVDYASEIADHPVWVIAVNDKIVGGLIMSFEEDKASIANIAVDPAHQGHGIGGTLMKFAVSKARENLFSELHLTTHVLLQENLSLYRHLGWTEIGRDDTKVFMQKRI